MSLRLDSHISRKYFSAALCWRGSPSHDVIRKKNSAVKNSIPASASGPNSGSPPSPSGGPCPSPCWPRVSVPRLRRRGLLPLLCARTAPFGVGGGVFACGAAAAGGVEAAPCGFPPATASTFGGAGGPPTAATAAGFAFAGLPASAGAGWSGRGGGGFGLGFDHLLLPLFELPPLVPFSYFCIC